VSIQWTTGSRGMRISGSNAGYTMFRGSVKGTGYPLHSHVSPSLPIPCVTVCHQVSTELYHRMSEVIDEVSHVPMSLYPVYTVLSIHSSHIFEKPLLF